MLGMLARPMPDVKHMLGIGRDLGSQPNGGCRAVRWPALRLGWQTREGWPRRRFARRGRAVRGGPGGLGWQTREGWRRRHFPRRGRGAMLAMTSQWRRPKGGAR